MSENETTTLGRYRLMDEIGQGGMSVVYRGIELDTGKSVAIKVLSPYVAQEPRFKARFDREVRLLSSMDHPNIVPILNYGEEQGKTYIVMPYYGGGTLQDLIEGDGIDLLVVGELLDDISAGLEYAHRAGIVHRDIKPSNIIIDDQGTARISDFGFAHVSDNSHSLTGSVLIGTPAFMSPEQCAGHAVDARSDQYSLGAVLYQAATGKLPFEADTPMAVVIKHINEPLPRPRYVNPYLPDVVETVIERAMAKQADDRYGSVAELNQALQQALTEALDPKSGLAKPESIGPAPATQVVVRPEPPIWRSRRALIGAALLLVLAIPAAAMSLRGGSSGGAEGGSEPATPNAALLATIDALSTSNAEQLEGSQEPGVVETAVAATVEAMGLLTTATPIPSEPPLGPTPSATLTATGVGSGGLGDDGGDDGGSDPPPPPPAATSPGGPTNTPPPPSNTPPPTDTSPPPTNTTAPPASPEPTTDPDNCKGPGHPVFPCTETPEP